MGRYKCCAENCHSSSESDVKFFKFPLYNPKKLKRWLQSMRREDWAPSRFSVLCIRHFEEQHLDRTGKSVTLKDDAVPTTFTSASEADVTRERSTVQTMKTINICKDLPSQVSNNNSVTSSKSKKGKPRGRPPKNRVLESQTTEQTEPAPPAAHGEDAQEGHREPEPPESWSIIIDEELMKIHSFPHFFHGNYCVSQDIQWAADNTTDEAQDSTSVIEVCGPWQWLGLDLRGPLPLTSSGHRFLLTLLDYSSRWIEAWPVESLQPQHTVEHLLEAVRHFGFPLRILSRLPLPTVTQINQQLKAELKVEFPLVVHHHRTGSMDLPTQQIIDRMVQELTEQHPSDWDVFVQAKVFSLCFKENPWTGERPFTRLCCSGTAPEHTPRGLQINQQLKAELKVEFPLVVHHHRTGSMDLPTQQIIDRMVQELTEQHPSDWDVFVQAKVFSLCFKENPWTGERPFTRLCCSGTAPEHTPRGLQLEELDLKDCEFVVK